MNERKESMSEGNLATALRQDAIAHASKEDKPFFEMMTDRAIIERILICKVCEQRVLAYEMATIANSMEDLDKLLVEFGDMEHVDRCLRVMVQLGPEGLHHLQIHREEQEEEQFSREVENFQRLFEQHKHELLDIMKEDGEQAG